MFHGQTSANSPKNHLRQTYPNANNNSYRTWIPLSSVAGTLPADTLVRGVLTHHPYSSPLGQLTRPSSLVSPYRALAQWNNESGSKRPGRPSLRNPALRRRISTTLAPRTGSPTARTTVTHTRAPQNATTRPRRPQVADYDYYEDEEEPVVGKSTFNGKLFLTSKGGIRCLDQGNFPHPYSCRKFITCARMVNGLVVGAEYTCPDKLSFDPVGGICNWSAGLGCKE